MDYVDLERGCLPTDWSDVGIRLRGPLLSFARRYVILPNALGCHPLLVVGNPLVRFATLCIAAGVIY
jgi:hypothetical protein